MFLQAYDGFQGQQETYQGYFIAVYSQGGFVIDNVKNMILYNNTHEVRVFVKLFFFVF